ncbi:MAG TPA: helix-turn-helix transcriptional regulator [Pirellulales bacterium]|jgi:ribosome-binding protein aMBF1 (putative translation factor)|nr:helix-turn-helix transcriptional regulator [Pirellulales bacterium]
MAKPRPKFTDQIRRAIEDSGVSRYQIAKHTGIEQSVLSRFMNGRLGFTLETLDKLADYLQFSLSSKGPKATRE